MDLKKLNKKILIIALSTFLTVPAFASIAVSPMRVEINANKVRNNYVTTALEVRGDANVPVRFKATSGYFDIDDKGEAVMPETSTSPYDLSKKIRFVPAEFNVQPGKTQKLRINVANLKSLPDGESRAMLYIEDINPKEYNIPTGRAGIGAQLIVKTRMGIPVYIDKGKFTKSAKIESCELTQAKGTVKLNTKIASTGNSRVRYTAKLQFAQGKKLIAEKDVTGGVIPGGKTFTKSETIDVKDVPSGEYTVKLIVSYLDENDKRKNIKNEQNIIIQGEM